MKTIVNSIEFKLGKLIEKYKKLQVEKSDLQQNISALNISIIDQEEQISSLKDKVKLINISKLVDTTSEDGKATRLKINEYVREIDKCIALLNK